MKKIKVFQFLLEILINFSLPLKEELLCLWVVVNPLSTKSIRVLLVIKTAYKRLTEEEKANETACQQLHDLKAAGISDYTLFHWTKATAVIRQNGSRWNSRIWDKMWYLCFLFYASNTIQTAVIEWGKPGYVSDISSQINGINTKANVYEKNGFSTPWAMK